MLRGFFRPIALTLLAMSSIVWAARDEVYVPVETPRDAISKYRAGCIENPNTKKIVAPDYCVLLGEEFEKLNNLDNAKAAYVTACKADELLGCIRAGTLFRNSAEEAKAIAFFNKACKAGNQEACKLLKKPEDSQLLIWMAVILIGIVTFLITKNIFQEESEYKAAEKLDDSGSKEAASKHGIVLKYSRPFFKRYVSPVVSSFKAKKRIRDRYRRVLASSGLTSVLTPDDFYSFKLFLILGFPILFLAIRIFLEEDWPLTLVPVLGVFGYFYPDLWIGGKIKNRQKDVIMAMPFCVDMLALSVEAGLDFVAAMQKVIEKAKKSAMTEEFEILMKEIKVGASRAEALRNLAWRINLIQVSSFAATLIAADSVGASIGPILKNLSAEIRQKKSSDVEKAGATAATKILFPMLFLIVPAVFIVVGAPIALEMMGARK